MIICSDSLEYAGLILKKAPDWESVSMPFESRGLSKLAERLYGKRPAYSTSVTSDNLWQFLIMVKKAPVSQYDVVVDLCQRNIELPHGLLCMAGSGEKFHGLRERSWAALPGNIHLTAHLIPNLKMAQSGIGFTIISALSVVDAIDRIPGLQGKAGIKWVNDILINDAKVSGFLTHTLSLEGLITSAVIGIGLNVEATPAITPDCFTARAVSLRQIVSNRGLCNQQVVFEYLIEALEQNYNRLEGGQLPRLLDRYRQRSLIIGREVEIMPDSAGGSFDGTVRGRVIAIGDNLELYLEGQENPISRGRLVLIK